MRLLLRLAVLGTLLAGVCAAAAQEPPQVTLRYKFVPNEVIIYHYESTVTSRSDVPDGKGGTMSVPIEMSMIFEHRQRVLGVTREGAATLRGVATYLGGSMRTTMDGHTYERISDAKKTRVIMDGRETAVEPHRVATQSKPSLSKVDSRGNVLSTDSPEAAKAKDLIKQALRGMPFPSLDSRESGGMGVAELPGSPVSVGDTWARTESLPMPGFTKPIEYKVTYRLAAIEPDESGRRIAIIEYNGDRPAAAQDDGGSAEYHSTGLIRWSLDEGKLVRVDRADSATMSLALPTPGAAPGAMATTTMSFQVHAFTVRK